MYIDKQKLIIIGGSVLLAALITVGTVFLVRGCSSGSSETNISGSTRVGNTRVGSTRVGGSRDSGTRAGEIDARRQNILRLAESYAQVGEYDRALNLIDGLLIDNPDDDEARALQMAILSMDRSGGNSTESLIEAQRRFLEEQQRQNAQMLANLPRDGSSAAVIDSSADEAAAQRRAAQEAEAARRRAEEEELARASRELQEMMRHVNNLVSDGKAALVSGDLVRASRLFDEAKRAMPPGENRFEAQKYSDIADAYYEYKINNPNANNASEAVRRAGEYANEAVAKDPSQALPHYVLGRVARDANQNDKAVSEFREAARLDPNNYLYAFDLGRSLFIARRYTEARDSFQNATRINPNFEPAWYNLGGTYRMLNRHDDALSAYRRAVGIKADYVAAHREIGRILQARNDARGAVEAFGRALQYSPNDYGILCELGAANSAAGNYIEAERIFTRALQINSSDAQTNYNMAIVKLELKKHTEAISFARLAVDGAPANAVYVYTLGLACEESGALDQAISAYQRSASLDTRYLRPRINLGSIYLARGNFSEAISRLNEALMVEPNNFEVNNNLGAVYAKMENWANSIVHYERALAARANDPVVLLNLARAYASAGNYENAQVRYQALVRSSPNNWDALFELGQTCVTLGQNDEARRYLQDLINRNPNYSNKSEAERILRSL